MENKTGRGIALYVRIHSKLDKQNNSEEEEWIKIRLQQDDALIIGCIYIEVQTALQKIAID